MILALLLAVGIHTPDLPCRLRDTSGRVIRSMSRRGLFMRSTGFPKGRPGWVVDHVVPLVCGGCDLPSNMQWLLAAEALRKDKEVGVFGNAPNCAGPFGPRPDLRTSE